MDPRVDRTREHVLASAQELLADGGAADLTFSSLAERARVSRNTLYRHWPSRAALLADVMVRYHLAGETSPAGTPEDALDAFLHGIREGLADLATVDALTQVIAAADHDEAADDALRRVHATRIATLRERLGTLDDEDFARIVGPLFFQRLIARGPISDELLARVGAELARAQRDA